MQVCSLFDIFFADSLSGILVTEINNLASQELTKLSEETTVVEINETDRC